MFLKLTHMPSEKPIRININHIEAYGITEENGANAYVSTNNSTYQIKENIEEIDKYFSPPMAIIPEMRQEDWEKVNQDKVEWR